MVILCVGIVYFNNIEMHYLVAVVKDYGRDSLTSPRPV